MMGINVFVSAFYFFLQGIPECVGLLALSLALARAPLRWGHILYGGIFLTTVNYVIRSLPVTFGFHLPVVIFLIFLLITKFTTIKPSKAIVAILSSLVVFALLEYCISTAYFAVSHADPQQVIGNQGLWAIIGLFQAGIYNMIALAAAHFIKPTEGLWVK